MQKVVSNFARRYAVANLVAVLVLLVALVPAALAYTPANNAAPAGAISASNKAVPPGVRILAQFPLAGPPATRMYTQWEHGKTYLYVEQGSQQITTVDITRKKAPHVVNHQPEKAGPMNVDLGEGEPGPRRDVIPGVDNVKDPGTISVLQVGNPQDMQLLRAFGHDASNLVDRDQHLVFFATPSRLLIVEDARWNGMDYVTN